MSLRGVGSEPPFPGDFRLLTPGSAGSHCCSMGRAAGSAPVRPLGTQGCRLLRTVQLPRVTWVFSNSLVS